MEQKQNDFNGYGGKGTPRIWSGFLLITAGVLLFAYKMGAPIPGWIFTWPVLLIAMGLLAGVKSRFHNPGAFIMIAIGSIFLVDQTSPALNFHNYILPAILIAVGLIYIFRPKHSCARTPRRRFRNMAFEDVPPANPTPIEYTDNQANAGSDENAEHLDINAVLGGVKKIILSKNFKGGEINCFMGGAEVDLGRADIQQPIMLEVNNIFAGTKLLVPSHWYVKNEINAVFGGVEDKRHITSQPPDMSKVLLLKGNCVFGGIEVSNY